MPPSPDLGSIYALSLFNKRFAINKVLSWKLANRRCDPPCQLCGCAWITAHSEAIHLDDKRGYRTSAQLLKHAKPFVGSARSQDCAQFCAPSPSQTIASGHTSCDQRNDATGAQNQQLNKQWHSILLVFGRPLSQRVAGSSPARLTTYLSLTKAVVSDSLPDAKVRDSSLCPELCPPSLENARSMASACGWTYR
jgi:hypothetical protein